MTGYNLFDHVPCLLDVLLVVAVCECESESEESRGNRYALALALTLFLNGTSCPSIQGQIRGLGRH
jgi:hypothetical protein